MHGDRQASRLTRTKTKRTTDRLARKHARTASHAAIAMHAARLKLAQFQSGKQAGKHTAVQAGRPISRQTHLEPVVDGGADRNDVRIQVRRPGREHHRLHLANVCVVRCVCAHTRFYARARVCKRLLGGECELAAEGRTRSRRPRRLERNDRLGRLSCACGASTRPPGSRGRLVRLSCGAACDGWKPGPCPCRSGRARVLNLRLVSGS